MKRQRQPACETKWGGLCWNAPPHDAIRRKAMFSKKKEEKYMDFLGKDMAKLGFGLMRLPMIGEEVDIE